MATVSNAEAQQSNNLSISSAIGRSSGTLSLLDFWDWSLNSSFEDPGVSMCCMGSRSFDELDDWKVGMMNVE